MFTDPDDFQVLKPSQRKPRKYSKAEIWKFRQKGITLGIDGGMPVLPDCHEPLPVPKTTPPLLFATWGLKSVINSLTNTDLNSPNFSYLTLERHTTVFISTLLKITLTNLSARNIKIDTSYFDSPDRWKLWLEHTGQYFRSSSPIDHDNDDFLGQPTSSISDFCKWLSRSGAWTLDDMLRSPYPRLLMCFLPPAESAVADTQNPNNLYFYPSLGHIMELADTFARPDFYLLKKWRSLLEEQKPGSREHAMMKRIETTMQFCIDKISEVAEDGVEIYGSNKRWSFDSVKRAKYELRVGRDWFENQLLLGDMKTNWPGWPTYLRAQALSRHGLYIPSLAVSIISSLLQAHSYRLDHHSSTNPGFLPSTTLHDPEFYSCLQNSVWQILGVYLILRSLLSYSFHQQSDQKMGWKVWTLGGLVAGSVVLSILSPCMFVLQPSLANLLGCLGQVLQAAVGVWLAWNDGDAGEVERRRRGKKKVD